MNRYFELSQVAATFSTRPKGAEVATYLDTIAESLKNDETLVIDFSGVKAVSFSFMDEFLSRVANIPAAQEKRLVITGWSKELGAIVDKSLQHRGCDVSHSKQRVVVCSADKLHQLVS